jgi:glycosyltransferase involved in cell wall biosynthesis
VVIPTYNEARRLPAVLGRVPEDVHEVIVVDGHSIDGTVEVARASRAGVRVVLQNRFGKGNALMCGFAAVTGDVVVMLDADGSIDPRDIPRFVTALVDGADFVRGYIATSGGTDDELHLSGPGVSPWLDRLVGALFGVAWSKLHYNCGAVWREHLDRLGLPGSSNDAPVLSWGDGFEIEPIISMRAMRAGMVITEIQSQPYVEDRSAALPQTWHDRVRTAGAICIERLRAKPRPSRGST